MGGQVESEFGQFQKNHIFLGGGFADSDHLYVCRICSTKSIKESQHQGGSEVTNLPAKELQDVSSFFF